LLRSVLTPIELLSFLEQRKLLHSHFT